MKSLKGQNKLTYKVLAVTLGIVLLLGVSMIVFIKGALTQKLVIEIQEKGIFMSRHLAEMSVDLILTDKTLNLLMMVNYFKGAETDIAYAYIVDSQGDIISHTFKKGFPSGLKELDPVGPGQSYRIQSLVLEGMPMYDIATPILKGDLGIAHIGISEENIRRSVADIIVLILKIIVGVLILGIVAAIVFARKLTKPLSDLVEAAEEIGGGNLDKEVLVSTQDEIGQLGNTFNKMIRHLKETTVSRDKLTEEVLERKQAEAEVQQKQQELFSKHDELNKLFRKVEVTNIERQKIMDAIDDMIIFTDDNGEMQRVNRAVIEFFGSSYKDILGKKWEELMHEQGIEVVTQHVGNIELLHASTGRCFTLKVYPFEDSAVDISGNIITLHNTTEIKNITHELEKTNKKIDENRMKLQGALSEVSSLIKQVIENPDHSVRFVNPFLKKCYETKNCKKESCSCFGKEAMRCWNIAGTYCGGEIQGAFAQKFGNCSLCEVYKEATTDPVYQIGEHFNNMMHILDTKNKELGNAYAELKGAEKTIRHEFEIQKIINELLNIFQINVPLNEMLESSINYLASIPWLSSEQKGAIFLVEDEPGMLEMKAQRGLAGPLLGLCARVPFGKCLCGRTALSGKVEFADRLDERHDIKFEGIADHGHYCVPIISAGQKLLGVFTLYTEVGHKYDDREVEVLMAVASTLAGSIDRRKMEATLSGQEKQLRQAYMDLQTSQSQIIQQEKMASIGQLAAGVAHEINNPVGFVTSNLGTLKKYSEKLGEFIEELTEAVERHEGDGVVVRIGEMRKQFKIDYILEDIEPLISESLDGTARVKTIVENLKSFSRVDAAKHVMTDMNECLETTLNIIWNELKYKTVVNKEYGEVPPIKCYPQQLNQVFMNLLVNAAQAIEKQGEVTIKTWSDNGSVYISISDTGSGIPEEKINKVFEPFFTTKEVGKGTGLGLSIAYDIVKNHSGEITVASEVGKGTTFTVKIPIVEE